MPLAVPATAVASSLFSVYYIKLSFDVINLRIANKVSLGSGGHDSLDRAIRAHGNFVEYAPLMLLQLGFMELNGAPTKVVAGFAAVMLLGRILHAHGITHPSSNGPSRARGMKITFASMVAAAVANVWYVKEVFGL